MTQGRGSGTIILLFCILVLYSQMVHAKTFVVGDSPLGWTYNLSTWPDGKNFTAGDILVFNYEPNDHDLVKVKESDYHSCKTRLEHKRYQSGNDHIALLPGWNYFICSFDFHCEYGMKIAVYAVDT